MCLCEIRPLGQLPRRSLSPSYWAPTPQPFPHLRHIYTHRRTHQGKTAVALKVQWRQLYTHIALERFLSCVGPHVLVQSSFLAEGLIALAALIRLLLQRHTHTHNLDLKRALDLSVCSRTTHKNSTSPVGTHMDKTWWGIHVHCVAYIWVMTHTCAQFGNIMVTHRHLHTDTLRLHTHVCSACQFMKIWNKRLYSSCSREETTCVEAFKNTQIPEKSKENTALGTPLNIYQCTGTLGL